ncbi:MAG: hypothetical protein JWN37_781 [Candidatus Nomurabacteria bacterium]|nr:hypothetical protein [Candidatus Nomurabacteria bacterium]
MAFESYYWRQIIKRDISYIKKLQKININSLEDDKLDEIISKVEIKVFIITFSIRKLLEARKIPDKVIDTKVSVIRHRRNSKRRGPVFDFTELFDFKKPEKISIKLSLLLNLIIHSYTFHTIHSKSKLTYLYFTSDFKKNEYLIAINLIKFLNIMAKVSNKQVKSIHTTYNKDTGDYDVKTY